MNTSSLGLMETTALQTLVFQIASHRWQRFQFAHSVRKVFPELHWNSNVNECVYFGLRESNSQLPFQVARVSPSLLPQRSFQFAKGLTANSDRNAYNSDRNDLKSPEEKH